MPAANSGSPAIATGADRLSTALVVDARDITLEDKVAFLARPESHRPAPDEVVCRETHMSWVFLAGARVYKLKKPVRFAYLDFSTLSRRETACRAELRLNRRLSPDVYLGVVPLTLRRGNLHIGGEGRVVEWLVMMRRLDEPGTLERTILDGRLDTRQLNRIASRLANFYRHARPVHVAPAVHLAQWRRAIADDRRVLLRAGLDLPRSAIRRTDRVLRHFLVRHRGLIVGRVRAKRIVDAHGDLRPEHIWIDGAVRIIDCLEFNRTLRSVDPMDEIAFLSLECERLGADWVGRHLRRRVEHALKDAPGEPLYAFYRCHRAMLRARLAIAHLLEPAPPPAAKWLGLAHAYIEIATREARFLEAVLNMPSARPGRVRRAAGGWLRRAGARRAIRRASRAQSPGAGGTAVPHR
jgi:uncharacterized protein